MGYFKPSLGDAELLSIPQAYHIVWLAGSKALAHETHGPDIKSIQAEAIGQMFADLDLFSRQASVIARGLPENAKPHVKVSELTDPLRHKINEVYSDNGADTATYFNPFSVEDVSVTALMALDIHIRVAKSNLLNSYKSD